MSSRQKNSTYLSSDPDKAIQDVMNSIDVLRGIYTQETEALTDADTPTFLSLQEKNFQMHC